MFQSSGEVQVGDGDLQGLLKLRVWMKPASVSSAERSRTDWARHRWEVSAGPLDGWWPGGEGLGTFTWARGGRLSDLSGNEGGAR